MSENNQTARLLSLDAMRGFTIMAMIIVNTPGSWDHVYPPLLHASWNGATPTDYIFPFFLFIVGVSVALAYQPRLDAGADKAALTKKILIRSLKIYALGIYLWLWPDFDFNHIRWVGVLHRIAFVFLACALFYLYTDWRTWIRAGAGILATYWIVMVFVPVPGIGQPDLSAAGMNLANYLDSRILPGVLWQKTWDPEGFLSTFPSIVTGITGMLAGRIILQNRDMYQRITWLFLAGFGLFVAGGTWDWFFPINKHIWTSSYVCHTSGLAFMTLAACHLVVDVLGMDRWTAPGRIFGANAITAYTLAGMLTAVFYTGYFGKPGPNEMWMSSLTAAGIPAQLASLTYAMLYVGIVFLPVYQLYRKKIFIRL